MTITKVGDEHLHCAMARCDSIDALKVFYWQFTWRAQIKIIFFIIDALKVYIDSNTVSILDALKDKLKWNLWYMIDSLK